MEIEHAPVDIESGSGKLALVAAIHTTTYSYIQKRAQPASTHNFGTRQRAI